MADFNPYQLDSLRLLPFLLEQRAASEERAERERRQSEARRSDLLNFAVAVGGDKKAIEGMAHALNIPYSETQATLAFGNVIRQRAQAEESAKTQLGQIPALAMVAAEEGRGQNVNSALSGVVDALVAAGRPEAVPGVLQSFQTQVKGLKAEEERGVRIRRREAYAGTAGGLQAQRKYGPGVVAAETSARLGAARPFEQREGFRQSLVATQAAAAVGLATPADVDSTRAYIRENVGEAEYQAIQREANANTAAAAAELRRQVRSVSQGYSEADRKALTYRLVLSEKFDPETVRDLPDELMYGMGYGIVALSPFAEGKEQPSFVFGHSPAAVRETVEAQRNQTKSLRQFELLEKEYAALSRVISQDRPFSVGRGRLSALHDIATFFGSALPEAAAYKTILTRVTYAMIAAEQGQRSISDQDFRTNFAQFPLLQEVGTPSGDAKLRVLRENQEIALRSMDYASFSASRQEELRRENHPDDRRFQSEWMRYKEKVRSGSVSDSDHARFYSALVAWSERGRAWAPQQPTPEQLERLSEPIPMYPAMGSGTQGPGAAQLPEDLKNVLDKYGIEH
jgi:hypothetical protein